MIPKTPINSRKLYLGNTILTVYSSNNINFNELLCSYLDFKPFKLYYKNFYLIIEYLFSLNIIKNNYIDFIIK